MFSHKDVARLMEQIVQVAAHAHSLGVLHLDLKVCSEYVEKAVFSEVVIWLLNTSSFINFVFEEKGCVCAREMERKFIFHS